MATYISFQPKDYVNTTLYTGTALSNAITGVGFQPDMTWLKDRTATAYHYLFDAARGATKGIFPNGTDEEAVNVQYLNAFDADGFTVGTNTMVNGSTKSYVSWNWKAGTTSGITTDGSTTITPSAYSFDAARGISIIKYTGNNTTGAKLAHGLGVAPQMVIIKALGSTDNWGGYHVATGGGSAPADYGSSLNTTGAKDDDANYWYDTVPDSVNITLGNAARLNASAGEFIAYCFTSITGYSHISDYRGSGNALGPFAYCGFRPSFILMKSDAVNNWHMYDDKRHGYNEENAYLRANSDETEGDNIEIDIVSNGFKIRTTDANINASGTVNKFLAFAEFPLVSSNDVPGVAR